MKMMKMGSPLLHLVLKVTVNKMKTKIGAGKDFTQALFLMASLME